MSDYPQPDPTPPPLPVFNTVNWPQVVAEGGGGPQGFQGDEGAPATFPANIDFEDPIAIGTSAGENNHQLGAIAIGVNAGFESQSSNAIALGTFAATDYQSPNAIAIGSVSGQYNQGDSAVAIGNSTGQYYQSQNGIAIGSNCGSTGQGSEGISIGFFAGYDTQGTNAIAVGTYAGYLNQGDNAIAIGHQASGQFTPQVANSIILNASGVNVDATESSLYVSPIREGPTGATGYALMYDTTTKEMMYTTTALVGAQGFQGFDGVNGVQGLQGDAGTLGPTGATGDWSLVDQQTFTLFTTGYPNYGNSGMWRGATGVPSGWRCAVVSASGKYMISSAQSGANFISRDYGQTWTSYAGGNGWSSSMALSASGQHQLICGNYSNGFRVSNDYGTTFTTRLSGTGVFSCCMSASGDTMYGVNQNASVYYKSTDFGTTWTTITPGNSNNTWRIACSSNGKILILGGTPNSFISFDGGNTFTVTTGEGFSNVSMNATGQYIFRSGYGLNSYISKDYGQTWTFVGNWPYCVWSASGQYSVLMNSSQLHISSDYGFNYQLSLTGSFNNFTDGLTSGVSMSANAQYILTGTPPSGAVPMLYEQEQPMGPTGPAGLAGTQGFQGIEGAGGASVTFNHYYNYATSLTSSGIIYNDTIGATVNTNCVRYTLNGQYQGDAGNGDTFQMVISDSTGTMTTSDIYSMVNSGTYNVPYQIVATVGNNPTTSNVYYLNVVLQIGGEWNASSPPVQNCLVGSINVGPTIPFGRSIIGNSFRVGFNFGSGGTVYLLSALKELF